MNEKPAGIVEEEIAVASGDFSLPATLTRPENSASTPLLILVHGSGPQDRDETVGPNKPFQEIAWGLAKRGVAVLRYDKRTYVYAEASAAALDTFTVDDETVDDAAAAFAAAEKAGYREIYLLGHSLGGMLIPRISEATSEAAGYIMLAAAARPLEDLIIEQSAYIFSLDGEMSAEESEVMADLEQQRRNIKDLTAESDFAPEKLLDMPAAYLLDLKGYEPAQAAAQITKPLLILQGEADYQVTMADFEIFQKVLSGKSNVSFLSYPKLNHLFMETKGEKSAPSDYQSAGCVDEKVLDDMASWLLKNGK